MNEIVNQFFLEADNVMPEMQLRQSKFTYNAWRSFTKNKNKFKNSKKQEV